MLQVLCFYFENTKFYDFTQSEEPLSNFCKHFFVICVYSSRLCTFSPPRVFLLKDFQKKYTEISKNNYTIIHKSIFF